MRRFWKNTPMFSFQAYFYAKLPDHIRIPLAGLTASDFQSLAQEAARLFNANILTAFPPELPRAPFQQIALKTRLINIINFVSTTAVFGTSAHKCLPTCPKFPSFKIKKRKARETPQQARSSIAGSQLYVTDGISGTFLGRHRRPDSVNMASIDKHSGPSISSLKISSSF